MFAKSGKGAVWGPIFGGLLAVAALNARASWEGVWEGTGTAYILGNGPVECKNVSYTVKRTPISPTAFMFTRSGTPQKCGGYIVNPRSSRVVVRDDKLYLPGVPEQLIGFYSKDRVESDFICGSCNKEMNHIIEKAIKTSEDSYELYSAVLSAKGQLMLEYRYTLSRVKR